MPVRRSLALLLGLAAVMLHTPVWAQAPEVAEGPADDRAQAFALPEALLASGQYELCALEYLRAGVSHPDLMPLATERAALCLQLDGRFAEAGRLLEGFTPDEAPPALLDAMRFRLCVNELMASRGAAMPGCPAAPPSALSTPMALRASYVPVMAALVTAPDPTTLELQPWSGAGDGSLALWVAEDRAAQQAWAGRPQKKPAVAALLSALIPGLGRGYIGRWADGAVTFSVVVLPAAISAVHYQQRGELTAWSVVGAVVSGAMYAGNIYGGYVGARAYNQQVEEAMRDEAMARYRGRLDP